MVQTGDNQSVRWTTKSRKNRILQKIPGMARHYVFENAMKGDDGTCSTPKMQFSAIETRVHARRCLSVDHFRPRKSQAQPSAEPIQAPKDASLEEISSGAYVSPAVIASQSALASRLLLSWHVIVSGS